MTSSPRSSSGAISQVERHAAEERLMIGHVIGAQPGVGFLRGPIKGRSDLGSRWFNPVIHLRIGA